MSISFLWTVALITALQSQEANLSTDDLIRDGDSYAVYAFELDLLQMKPKEQACLQKSTIPKLFDARHREELQQYLEELESSPYVHESLTTYTDLINLYSKCYLSEDEFLKFLHRISFEKVLSESLSHFNQEHNLLDEQKKHLYTSVKDNFLLNLSEYNTYMNEQKSWNIQWLKRGLDTKALLSDKEFPELKSIRPEAFGEKDVQYVLDTYNGQWRKLNDDLARCTTKEQIKEFSKGYKAQVADYNKSIEDMKLLSQKELSHLQSDPNNYLEAVSGMLFYMSNGHYAEIKTRYINLIAENHRLLDELR